MRVGDQHHALASFAQGAQKQLGIRAQGDQVGDLALEVTDRQPQLAAPEVGAVPVQRTGMLAKQRQQLGLGQRQAEAVVLGVALRQVGEPEVVVEVQVEQGAVHIQQDGVDLVPGQWGHGVVLRSKVVNLPACVANVQSAPGIIGKAAV